MRSLPRTSALWRNGLVPVWLRLDEAEPTSSLRGLSPHLQRAFIRGCCALAGAIQE